MNKLALFKHKPKPRPIEYYIDDIIRKLDMLSMRINVLEDRVFGVMDMQQPPKHGVSFGINHPIIELEEGPSDE